MPGHARQGEGGSPLGRYCVSDPGLREKDVLKASWKGGHSRWPWFVPADLAQHLLDVILVSLFTLVRDLLDTDLVPPGRHHFCRHEAPSSGVCTYPSWELPVAG